MLVLALVVALVGSTLGGAPEPVAPAPAPAEDTTPPSVGAEPPAEPATPSEAAAPGGTEPPAEPAAPREPEAPLDPSLDPSLETEPAADDPVADGSAGDPFELQPSTSDGEAPAEPGRRRRDYPPSLYGRAWITGGIGASNTHVSFGVGGAYFVIPWVGVGLDLDDTIRFAAPSYNLFQVTPKVVLLALPYRRITPLLQAGLGGAFFNAGIGAYGRWVAGAGLAMAFGRFNMRAGVDVDGLVPDDRFADAIAAKGFRCTFTTSPCSLGISPWLGFGVGF